MYLSRNFGMMIIIIQFSKKQPRERQNQKVPPSEVESRPVKSSRSIKYFSEYKTTKGKQWHSTVKGGKAKGTKTLEADQEVLIYFGLFKWNRKENVLKSKRGKKVKNW